MDQKQLDNLEYFDCLDSIIASGAICTREITQDCHGKSSTRQDEETFHQQTELQPMEKIVKLYICSLAVHGAETWTLRRLDEKCLEIF